MAKNRQSSVDTTNTIPGDKSELIAIVIIERNEDMDVDGSQNRIHLLLSVQKASDEW